MSANQTAEHKVGDVLYFVPSERRVQPARIPSGEVMVTKVIDHGEPTPYAPRFTYVVQVEGVSGATQGTDASELFAFGAMPVDYRFWETYSISICSDCKKTVAYANTKIVSEPIPGEKSYGQMQAKERRVCVAC